MKKAIAVVLAMAAALADAGDVFSRALVWASPKAREMRFELRPAKGKYEWTEGAGEYRQEGEYGKWNEAEFTVTAKDAGRYFIGLSAPHVPDGRKPEIAWADIRFEGVELKNLDFARGLQEWGISSKEAPRIVEMDGRKAMVARSDRRRYRAVDLAAGQTVRVKANFWVMGPGEAPKGQYPLGLGGQINGTFPESVTLPAAKREFAEIAVDTADPAKNGGMQVVRFKNGNVTEGHKTVKLEVPEGAGKCRYLYLLGASSWTRNSEKLAGTVEVVYGDGTKAELPLEIRKHVYDWGAGADSEETKAVWGVQGDTGLRHISLTRVVLDERKEAKEIRVTTAENSNLFLAGATLTSREWKKEEKKNIEFRLGPEWRRPDMPSRNIVAGSAIDMTGQMDFSPCGTYGRVVPKGEDFVFEKRPDAPLRFMGNHSSQVWVCDGEPDEKEYCAQMQRAGCNAIRLSIHRLTGDWWYSREECLKRYKMSDGFFVDERLDNFMRFVAEFNRRGIYLLLASQGGPVEIEAMLAGDAEALEYYRQFTVRILNKRNPYTGNLLKDEPCVMGWQFANEQSVQHVCNICQREGKAVKDDRPSAAEKGVHGYWARKVRAAVKPKWEAFLKRKYGADWEAHKAFPKVYTDKTQNGLDFQRFSQELMDAQMAFYKAVIKEAGWTGHVSWGNYDKLLSVTENRVKNGMPNEVNNYHSFLAEWCRGPQISNAGDCAMGLRDIAGANAAGMPMLVTEYNDCKHNKYCHEMGLTVGAYAALQGWGGFFLHNSTVITDAIRPGFVPDLNDGLVVANNASMRASTFLAACLYGRGDAATSKQRVRLEYKPEFMETLSATGYPDSMQTRLMLLSKLSVDWPELRKHEAPKADLAIPGFGNDAAGTYEFLLAQSSDSKTHTAVLEAAVRMMREKGMLKAGNRTDVKAGVYESDTGETLTESATPRMTTVTKRTEAATLPDNSTHTLKNLKVERLKRNATVAAVAVDGKELAESGRIVIVLDGECAVNGSVKTPDRYRYVDWGPRVKGRPVGETIHRTNVAELRLRNLRGGEFDLYPLTLNGLRREALQVKREGDELVFTLDTSAAALPHGYTPFFELVERAAKIEAPAAVDEFDKAAEERAAKGVVKAARGEDRFTDMAALPVTDAGAQIHYEGSIDRGGFNADFNWGTYKDKHGDWVLMETDKPGCIFNFVQHRFISCCEEPTFKFYFDGEDKPRFTIKPKEFGMKPPFLSPLSGRQFWQGNAFAGHPEGQLATFSIVRAFCPMEFRKGCKVTSSAKLEGIYPGGWGHIMYHTYPDAEGLETFDPDKDFSKVARRYERPMSAGHDGEKKTAAGALAPGERRVAYKAEGRGTITEVAATLPEFRLRYDPAMEGAVCDGARLTNLWVEITFDGKKRVEAPLATFYGNYIAFVRGRHAKWRQESEGTDGNLTTALLTFDISREDGKFSNRFPMPYWEGAEVAFVNKGAKTVALGEITVKTNSRLKYDRKKTGYFTAAEYVPPAASKEKENVFLGQLVGRGQLAYSSFAGLEHTAGGTCEGDVRLYLDTLSAPAVQSDGTESWGCWGMGFSHGPRLNPFSFYVNWPGRPKTTPNGWSLMRLTVVDCCYFDHFMRFELEHGGENLGKNQGVYGGQVFAYLQER